MTSNSLFWAFYGENNKEFIHKLVTPPTAQTPLARPAESPFGPIYPTTEPQGYKITYCSVVPLMSHFLIRLH